MTFYSLKIKEVRQETSDCVSVAFDVPPQYLPHFSFTQGQYLTLKTVIGGAEIRRSYSICSSPFDAELRIAIKQVEGGIFSTFANKSLKKGMVLDVASPEGRFHTPLSKEHQKRYVLVAAGSGITPIFSILKTVLTVEKESHVTLIYGNKNTASIIFREQIEGLKNKYIQRLRVIYVLSREKMDAELLHGRINALKIKELCLKMPEILRGSEYFLCGPESMINDLKAEFLSQNIDKNNVHFELFGTNKTHQKAQNIVAENAIAEAKIKLDGVTFDVPIHEGESVLDAALRIGADVPFACKGGVCCTCRAKVMGGEVAMDVNYALSEEEVENGFILTCQAKAKTRELVVDFDVK